MFSYSLEQWLFFFYFYCFFGWCFESTYVSLKKRQFVNRGFMRGPFLPLYGSGAMMMLIVSKPFEDSVILVYIAGCLGATVLEYVTGVCMEALFHVRYWDYSNLRFQFQGHICLTSSLAWGALTVLMTEFLHIRVEAVMLAIPPLLLKCIVVVGTVLLLVDFTWSFKEAWDIRNLIVKLEKHKRELQLLQKRMEVMLAIAGDDFQELKQNMEELRENMQEYIDERIVDRYLENKEDLKQALLEHMNQIKMRHEGRMEFIRDTVEGRLDKLYKRNPSMIPKHLQNYIGNANDKMSGKKSNKEKLNKS